MATKKEIDTEKFIDDYVSINKQRPFYADIANHFNISIASAHFRCRNFRHKLRNNNKDGCYVFEFSFSVYQEDLKEFDKLIEGMKKYIKNTN